MAISLRQCLLLTVVTTLLCACGGGRNDPPTPPLPPLPPAPPTNVAPAITLQPANQAVTEPAVATFTATASGTPTPTLQWQSSGDGVTYANISGATGTSYSTGATATAQTGWHYRVVATNVAGTATSNAAVLTVNPVAATLPTIGSHPSSQTVIEPATAMFAVTANGAPAPTYQWQLSAGGASYVDIPGATGSSYVTPSTDVSQSGNAYRVVVTNSAGSVTSNSAVLTVAAPPTLPVITTQPTAQSVNEPNGATFAVVATGNPSPSYQWQLSTDGVTFNDVANANNASYDTGATSLAQSGHLYRVVVSNSVGSVTSDSVQLSVSAAASGGTIVFTRNGGNVNVNNYDLYAIRESGGAEIPLATSAGNENFCGVTPAGRVIYSVDVGGQFDIHSVNVDGTDTRVLANSSDNEFCSHIVQSGAAAGRLIYGRGTTANGLDLYAVNADGTQSTPLATSALDEGFVGMTENNRVIFHRSSSIDVDVYSVDLEGLAVVPLANTANYEGFAGTAAGLVVIGRESFGQGDLYIVGDAGVGFGPLAADPGHDENLVGVTPGGVFIIKSRNLHTSARTLYAGGIPLVSDSDDITYHGSTATHVAYGKYVGFDANAHIVRIDGTQAVALSDTADGEAVVFLTADNRVVYERYAINGSTVTLGDVYLINVDGTNRVPLAVSADHESFAALMGNRLLYRREIANSVNNIQLWSVNLDGTGNARVLNLGGQSYFAAATPSGKVLIRNYTGINHLYIADTDGAGARLLVTDAIFNAVIP